LDDDEAEELERCGREAGAFGMIFEGEDFGTVGLSFYVVELSCQLWVLCISLWE
jgi:hypothetical protein